MRGFAVSRLVAAAVLARAPVAAYGSLLRDARIVDGTGAVASADGQSGKIQ
ncbi:MAG: hypothetical protein ACK53C_01140 [Pseudomonadota bacterium]